MTPDKDIQELFNSIDITPSDGEKFIAGLQERLDRVEYIKEMQEAQTRRFRHTTVTAFICGVLAGAMAMALMSVLPSVVLTKLQLALGNLHLSGSLDTLAIVRIVISILTGTIVFIIIENIREISRMLKTKSV